MPPRKTTKPDESLTPFLKFQDVKVGDVLTLSGFIREQDGRYGQQIIAEVTLNRTGKTFDLGIKVGGPNHRQLFRLMGADWRKWRGQISVKPVSRNGYDFIEVIGADSEHVPFDVPGDAGQE